MPGYDPFATPTGAQHDQVMPGPTPVTSALGAIAAPVRRAITPQPMPVVQAPVDWRASRPLKPSHFGPDGQRLGHEDWRAAHAAFKSDMEAWKDSRHLDPMMMPPVPQVGMVPGVPGSVATNPGTVDAPPPIVPDAGQPPAWAPPPGWTPPANWDGTKPERPADGSIPAGWTPPPGWAPPTAPHNGPPPVGWRPTRTPPQGVAVGEYNPASWRARLPAGA